MTHDDLLTAIAEMDDEWLLDAAPDGGGFLRQRRLIVRWSAVAVGVAAAVMAVVMMAPFSMWTSPSVSVTPTATHTTAGGSDTTGVLTTTQTDSVFTTSTLSLETTTTTTADGQMWQDDRRKKSVTVETAETAVVWRWEHLLPSEQYRKLRFLCNGKTVRFDSRGSAVSEAFLGDVITSEGTVSGYDEYLKESHTRQVTVRRIVGVSQEVLVAVDLDGVYYVFHTEADDVRPASFGEFIELYQLSDTLPLVEFRVRNDNNAAEATHALSSEDSAAVWEMLRSCGDARVVQTATDTEGIAVSFSATSELLGIRNRVFTILSSGYVDTNIADYGYTYAIGEEAAKRLIDYVTAQAKEADEKQTPYVLVGTITEIGEDYVKIEDSIVMEDPEEGMEFTVFLHDLRVRRYFLENILRVGNTVQVLCDGIYADAPLYIDTAYQIKEVEITPDEGILIRE